MLVYYKMLVYYLYTKIYICIYLQPAENAPLYESQVLTGRMSGFA